MSCAGVIHMGGVYQKQRRVSVTGDSDFGLKPSVLAQYWLERGTVLTTICHDEIYVLVCKQPEKL